MNSLKALHRILGILLVIFFLFLSITGLIIQSIDLRKILSHAPLNDPDMMGMMELQGGSTMIIGNADLHAPALPAQVDLEATLQRVAQAARATLGTAPLRYVELRMAGGKLVGNVQTSDVIASFDGASGSLLHQDPIPQRSRTQAETNSSQRYYFKSVHRLSEFGVYPLYINMIAGVGLFVMLFTGVAIYFKLLAERRQTGLRGFFWVGGQRTLADWKRAMHRWVAILAAIFLFVVTGSGLWLSYESLYFGIVTQKVFSQVKHTGPINEGMKRLDPSLLLNDAQIPDMAHVTLNAEQKALKGAPIKVVRLRNFGNRLQGIVLTGQGNDTRQVVFDARTGRPVDEIELSHPAAGIPIFFPFGWDAHQIAKAVHRGSFFGFPARFLDMFAGLSLLYLCINGIALYFEMWQERRKMGKKSFFWRGNF